ncbi:hypothetical protein IG631_08961 [Alternaria alternata]|nr:hypothetical protein IG631_08961 [Alternaria alternata]
MVTTLYRFNCRTCWHMHIVPAKFKRRLFDRSCAWHDVTLRCEIFLGCKGTRVSTTRTATSTPPHLSLYAVQSFPVVSHTRNCR